MVSLVHSSRSKHLPLFKQKEEEEEEEEEISIKYLLEKITHVLTIFSHLFICLQFHFQNYLERIQLKIYPKTILKVLFKIKKQAYHRWDY